MSIVNILRNIQNEILNMSSPRKPLSYENWYPKALGIPPCTAWDGHRGVYADNQLTCITCGYQVSLDSEPRVRRCTAWNGHLYTRVPSRSGENRKRSYYCPICLSHYEEETN